MIPRMTALIALLALLLSGPACRAESLGDVPQVVDAVADKQVIDPPSQPPGPPLAPDKNGREAAAEVENQRRFNELRRELVDWRDKQLDQWLSVVGIFLATLTLAVVIIGLFSLQKLFAAEKKADELVGQIEEHHERAVTTAQDARENPTEAAQAVASVQRDPAASVIDRALADAVLLQQQGKIKEAIEKWRSIANVMEEDRQLQALAWCSIGYLYGEGADLEAAVDAYTRAIELNPAYALAYNNRGNAKHGLGRHEAALADYDRAIELEPTDAGVYNNRGVAKHSLGRHQAALADYDRAIELNPAYAGAYNNRGAVKNDLDQHQAALADLDRAIELNPAYADAYNNRGVAKHSLGQHQAALADLDRAIKLNPAYVDVYNNRGAVKNDLGQHQAALADLDRAIELNPAYADAYNNRGNAKNGLGQHQAALADYDRAIELNPAYALAYNNRGLAKEALDRHDEALADYDRAIELNPAYAAAYNNRGVANQNFGRITEAIKDYQKAIDLAQEAGNENIVTTAKRNLSRLDESAGS